MVQALTGVKISYSALLKVVGDEQLAENYAKKIIDPIEEKVMYGQAMTFKTVSGRWFRINITENRNSTSNPYIYLNEVVNGKSKRIPKSEW